VSAGARRALITGIAGQDGSYLAEQLLADGYEVHGIIRPPIAEPQPNIEQIRDRLELIEGELLEPGTLKAAIERTRPHELYHLAAPTFVPDSWLDPAGTVTAIAGVTAELLEAVRAVDPETRVLIATSREIYGDPPESPQNELTPCRPISPYGVAKLAGHQLVGVLRARYGLHASSAILYNHESVRRPEYFVTRKVTRAAAAISLGLEGELVLGDLDAVRDWSAATDVMRGVRLMLAEPEPGDYVLASGVGRTVRELVRVAFACVDLDPDQHLRLEPDPLRARERTPAVGDPSKARERLGWEPRVGFEELIGEMVAADLARLAAPAN
jgi:GDPmannose 4,6-dehydratase